MGLQIPCPGGLCSACLHEMKNSELPGRPPFLRSALRADFVMGEERYCLLFGGSRNSQGRVSIRHMGNKHNLSTGEGCIWFPLIDCVWLREKAAEEPRLTWD